MRHLHAFDFDGTLTTRDSFLELIHYAFGTRALLTGFLRHIHLMVLMKLHLYSNDEAKQKMFTYFFGGMSLQDFNTLCARFAEDNRHLLRPEGCRAIAEALVQGDEVVIVSASIDNWVQPFFPALTVIGTQIETTDGRLTGRFTTPDCYGPEKVRRLLEHYPRREEYRLTAYGDSRGDRELLALADESYYQPFQS